MPGELHRHRSERRRSPFLLFLKTYWVEILIVVGLILSIFLLFEQMNIRGTLLGWAVAAGNLGLNLVARLVNGLMSLRSRLGLSELIAIPMLIGVILLLIWRIRWRLRNTPALVDTHCPRCGGELQRVHRRSIDRAISIFVPVRRYRCNNRECGWSGVRVSTSTSHGRGKPAAE
jgi:hypothetical protein